MNIKKIWIDAGHGNKDPGAVSGSRREANDNLRLARAIEPLLRARGFAVGTTRTVNNFTTGRVQAAVNFNADIYISLHRNDNEGVSGFGYETITKISHSKADDDLARAVHKRMIEAGVQRDRGIKRINLQTLAALPASIAGCTLEVGFMRNARDNQLFDENLQRYAHAVVQGIIDVYGAVNPEFTTADVSNILRHIAGVKTLGFNEIKRFDFDGDGVIKTSHAVRVLREIAGLDNVNPAAPRTINVGGEVMISAPYTSSAFDVTAKNTKMIGERRFVTRIHTQNGVNFAYQLGVKPGDTSAANTTGFANAGGLIKV